MPVWGDTFDRADGALGSNWAVTGVSMQIENNGVHWTGTSRALAGPVNAPTDATATIVITTDLTHTVYPYPIVKADAVAVNHYELRYTGDSANGALRIYRRLGAASTAIGTAGTVLNAGANPTLRLTYSGGALAGFVNGVQYCSATDTTYSGNAYCGFYSVLNAPQIVDSFEGFGTLTRSMSVSPSTTGTEDGDIALTITGHNTTWTPGTPGSPVFTCTAGALANQVISAGDAATATFSPPLAAQTVTIWDEIDGIYATINVVEGHYIPGINTPGTLSQNAVDYIEFSSQQGGWGILNQGLSIDLNDPLHNVRAALGWLYRSMGNIVDPLTPMPAGPTWIDDLYARIWGGEQWIQASFTVPGDNSLAQKINEQRAKWVKGAGPDEWRVDSILGPDVFGHYHTLGDIADQLGVEGQPSISSIADAIYQHNENLNDTGISLTQAINAIRSGDMYDLDDVRQWILENPPPSDPKLQEILDFLVALQGNPGATVWDAQFEATAANTSALGAYNAIQAMSSNGLNSLQTILDYLYTMGSSDLQPVLDAIEALRNGASPSVKTIMDSISAYRTPQGYTVQHILDAIGAEQDNPNYSALALIALLALALMGAGTKLGEFVTKLAGGKLDLIVDIVGTLIDAANFFHTLWDHFNPSSPTYSPIFPPPYPGAGGVQLGEPIAFTSQATIALPMHGALIDITTPGEHPFAIRLSEPTRYGRLGVFSFRCDDGRYEPIQPVQWLNQVATPKSIVSPSGIVVQCKAGTIGTVTPYTLK